MALVEGRSVCNMLARAKPEAELRYTANLVSAGDEDWHASLARIEQRRPNDWRGPGQQSSANQFDAPAIMQQYLTASSRIATPTEPVIGQKAGVQSKGQPRQRL
jgi:hypothetical protein